jgi:hypothetical protein
MRLSQFRTKLLVIACAGAVAGLLPGCGGSGGTASTAAGGGSTSGTGSSGSQTPPITGVATPHSVSVVTAN